MRNEAEIHAGLERRGFQILRPETLSFGQQVAAFSGAHHIIGVHGSGLVNAVWARDLAGMLELSPSKPRTPFGVPDRHFPLMMRSLGAWYERLRATEAETVSPGDHMSDFTLKADTVFDAVERLLAGV